MGAPTATTHMSTTKAKRQETYIPLSAVTLTVGLHDCMPSKVHRPHKSLEQYRFRATICDLGSCSWEDEQLESSDTLSSVKGKWVRRGQASFDTRAYS